MYQQFRPQHALFFLPLLLFPAQATQNVTCFYPDGDPVQDRTDPNDYYQACPTSANKDGIYMCCKTAGGFNDVCTSDGLCARPHNPPLGEVQGILRSGCTDPSWTSASCLKLCASGIDYSNKKANATEQYVQKCADGSFCCQSSNIPLNSSAQAQVDSCCSQKQGIVIKNGEIVSTSASASTTATSTPTATTSPSSTSAPPPPPPPKSNTGAIAGGVVGGVAALAIIVAAVFFLLRRKRSRRSNMPSHLAQEPLRPMGIYAGELDGRNGVVESAGTEIDAKKDSQYTAEKDGAPQRFEKDGGQVSRGSPGPYEL